MPRAPASARLALAPPAWLRAPVDSDVLGTSRSALERNQAGKCHDSRLEAVSQLDELGFLQQVFVGLAVSDRAQEVDVAQRRREQVVAWSCQPCVIGGEVSGIASIDGTELA